MYLLSCDLSALIFSGGTSSKLVGMEMVSEVVEGEVVIEGEEVVERAETSLDDWTSLLVDAELGELLSLPSAA